MAIFRLFTGNPVLGVHIGTAGIDHRGRANIKTGAADRIPRLRNPLPALPPGPGGLDVIGGDTAIVEAFADEIEDEAGIIVVQVAI